MLEPAKQLHVSHGAEVVDAVQELAPLVELADVIVDLVATGKTLKANGLVELEHIADVSSRLVVNKAAMKTKHAALRYWLDRFREATETAHA